MLTCSVSPAYKRRRYFANCTNNPRCDIDSLSKICYHISSNFCSYADTGGIPLSRPKKQKKTVQERKQAAAQRQAERRKRDDRITYIMMGVILVVVVAFFAAFTFL